MPSANAPLILSNLVRCAGGQHTLLNSYTLTHFQNLLASDFGLETVCSWKSLSLVK